MGVRVRQREGAWWVFINHQGKRKAKRVGIGETAKKAAYDAARQIHARLALGKSAFVTATTGARFAEYAIQWLERIKHTRKPSTYEDYNKMLDGHILPVLREFDLQDISREKVKSLAFGCLEKGLSPKSVQNVIRCLSSLLSHAVEDGLVTANVALKPGKFLPRVSRRRAINPFTREEVGRLLETAKTHAPRYRPLLLCAVRTGMRLGELLALQWGDLDFHGRFIVVQRNYTRGEVVLPKSGDFRRVDMSRELSHALKDLHAERQLESVANGWKAVPEWVFCSEVGVLLDPDNFRHRVFYALIKKGELRRIRFHDLRHTFASLLLQQGESPVYVKEQLGHSSIAITVDLYGHLIPGGNRQAVDKLDEPVEKLDLDDVNATPAQPAGVGCFSGDVEGPENKWCARQELNLRPAGSKPDALSN
jgi:integrase